MRIFCFHVLLICGLALPSLAQQRIALNQLSYYPLGPKVATITGLTTDGPFYIMAGADTVFKGRMGPEAHLSGTGQLSRSADFSKLQRPGTYQLLVPGMAPSYAFSIGDNALHALSVAVLKGYYYQRASMPLEERYAGQWHRAAGHPDTAVLIHASAASAARPEGTVVASSGGWYDAGDYNKYVVNSGISTATLLSAYEDFPAYYDTLRTNIPESGLPDILEEALYNLRWMLSMQDPNDGGAYHKCTNASFDGMVMPGVTKLPRYLVQKGTAATLDFAAVAAQAARIFGREEPALADSCRKAALAAYAWAVQHPAVVYDQEAMNKQFAPAITTGAYGDKELGDEFLWAASELYITTHDKRFLEAVQARIGVPVSLPSWSNVQLLGYYTLLRFPAVVPDRLQKTVVAGLSKLATQYIATQQKNPFGSTMSEKDFNWGSNSNVANQAVLLLQLYRHTKQPPYAMAALADVDYLLGRNATGYCFVTGMGSRSPMHPHHRPSVADGIEAPVPGLLVGGPNPGMQDHQFYPATDAERAYVDNDAAYASNEIAINWNAPLVYLSGALEALQYELGYSKH